MKSVGVRWSVDRSGEGACCSIIPEGVAQDAAKSGHEETGWRGSESTQQTGVQIGLLLSSGVMDVGSIADERGARAEQLLQLQVERTEMSTSERSWRGAERRNNMDRASGNLCPVNRYR